jgi:hypothetical protein
LTPPQLVRAEVRGNPQQPGPKGIAAQVGEVTPGGDEGFLGNVLGCLALTQESQAEVKDDAFVLLDELVEGGEVAAAGAAKAIVLHMRISRLRAYSCQIANVIYG